MCKLGVEANQQHVFRDSNMAVTLKQIAEKAGVSPSTVSHAIRGILPGKRPLASETVIRIRNVASELGYRPNMLAAGLAKSKTYTIGVLVASLRGDFYERILEGITHVVHPQFTPLLTVHNYDKNRERRELEVLIGKRVDGIIAAVSGCDENVPLYSELINTHHIPLVFVDRSITSLECPVVRSDHFRSTYIAVKELYGLGHRRIVFGVGGRETDSTQIFKDGYIQAMRDAGCEASSRIIFKQTGSWTKSELKQFASELIASIRSSSPRPTALLVQADWLAYEVLAECQLTGIKVPEELSVMGMEDCDPSALPGISLSTIKVELEQVGRIAAEILLKLMNGQRPDRQKVLIPPSTILRKTTRMLV